jgi:hypothetical protein
MRRSSAKALELGGPTGCLWLVEVDARCLTDAPLEVWDRFGTETFAIFPLHVFDQDLVAQVTLAEAARWTAIKMRPPSATTQCDSRRPRASLACLLATLARVPEARRKNL